MRKRWPVIGGALLLAVLALGGTALWQTLDRTKLERAVSLAPAQTERFTWTDWAGVRAELGADIGASSSDAALSRFLDDAYAEDLSPMSTLLESAPALQESYGFSPASLQWELLAQSPDGAAVLMQLGEEADVAAIGDRLESLGYQRPQQQDGVWIGGRDLLPSLGTLSPAFQYVALDEGLGLVVASDSEDYAATAIGAATGEGDGFEGLDEVLAEAGDPLAAAVYGSDVACNSLAMGNASDTDQDQGRQLLAAAGPVNPLTGFAMTRDRGDVVRVVMSFADDDQARRNADTRARLASGPAPGQGGDFSDRFRLGRVSADGPVVTMRLAPVAGSYVLSDLSSGPVLFATC